MTEQVIGLRGGAVPNPLIEDEAQRVVRVLEKALADARTGKYFGIGIVMVAADGDTEVDTRRDWDTTVRAPPTRLVAGLHMLVADIAAGRE